MGDDGQRQPTGDGLEVRVPLTDFVKRVAKEAGEAAAEKVLEKHQFNERIQANSDKIGELRTRAALVLGIVIGSGLLGGAIGAGLTAVFGK